MSFWIDDTKSKARVLMSYGVSQWREDMVSLIVDNWNANQTDAEAIMDAVICTCTDSFKGVVQSYSYCPRSEVVSSVHERFKKEMRNSDHGLTLMYFDLSYRELLTKIERGCRQLWEENVESILHSITEISIKPNGYDTAVECWWSDAIIPSPPVKFESVYNRGKDDPLYSPAAALRLTSLVYAEMEQGVPLMRSLIGFMVRDMMDILSVLQWSCHEKALAEFVGKSLACNFPDPNPAMFEENMREILDAGLKHRDSIWFDC
ncbi:hypothetical protein [Photobacterium damselae]|uniref:hypothetical protein n=1 Tax=Photobacterium damselae TaxID=38293 RepID=UPI0040694527